MPDRKIEISEKLRRFLTRMVACIACFMFSYATFLLLLLLQYVAACLSTRVRQDHHECPYITLAASFLCIDSYQDHYGLEDVKERILEHIAVNFLQDPCFACHIHPNDWTVRVGPVSLRVD